MTAKNARPVAAAPTRLEEIPIDHLLVSADEARKTIDPEALEELAASIPLHGVQEPLLVRPLRAVLVELEDGTTLDSPPMSRERQAEFLTMEGIVRTDVDDTWFEIVAGQRRLRASELAGKTTCPCIVREVGDGEAAEWRIASNLQREDLPPMEEAEAYGQLLARPGATIESVASALAKSPSYVARRLKLLDAIEPVREALKSGAIEIGHALELARLSQRQQEQLLDWLDVGYSAPDPDGDDDDEEEGNASCGDAVPGKCAVCQEEEAEIVADGRGWANAERTVCSDPDCVREARQSGALTTMVATRTTVAELRSRITRTELRVLRDVPFPLDDEIPPMACTACPKRAAGAASLFADVAEDTCTDPECLQAKLRVWAKYQLESAHQAGRKLAMLYDGSASDKAGVSRWNCVVGAECAGAEDAIWVNGARIGHMVQICRDKKCPEHGAGAQSDAASGSKGGVPKAAAAKQSAEEKRRAEAQKAERAKLAEKVKKERAYRERLFAAIAQLPEAQIDGPRVAVLTRELCVVELAERAGDDAELARALGWDAALFHYGAKEQLASQLSRLSLKGALKAAAVGMAVEDLPVSEWGVSQGKAPERMERIASWLGIDCKALRSGKPAQAPAVKQPAKPKAAPFSEKKGAKAPTPKAARPAKTKKPVLSAQARKRIAAAQRKRWAALRKGGAK